MSWQYSDAPSHIAPEVGPSLLTGGGPWSGVVLEPGAVYALSVEVNAPGETTVGWGVAVTDGSGGEYVLADPADAETVPGGQWVTVTRNLPAPGFPTTASVTLTVPAGTQARNPSMGVRTGRTVLTVPGDVLAENIMASGGIVAGTPDGARVELTDQGLVAFDATGTETAHIKGEGGEFVGGSFSTSDDLPGQVRMSDTAFDHNGFQGPGISVAPSNAQGYTSLPGIGPIGDYIVVSGGENDVGSASMQLSATLAYMWANSTGGDYSQIYTSPITARLERRDQGDELLGHIGVYGRQAQIHAGDLSDFSSFIIDPNGIRILVGEDGAETEYDLKALVEEYEGRISGLEARIAALES